MRNFIQDLSYTTCLYLRFFRVKQSQIWDLFQYKLKYEEYFSCWLFYTRRQVCDKRLLNVFYSKEESKYIFSKIS